MLLHSLLLSRAVLYDIIVEGKTALILKMGALPSSRKLVFQCLSFSVSIINSTSKKVLGCIACLLNRIDVILFIKIGLSYDW